MGWGGVGVNCPLKATSTEFSHVRKGVKFCVLTNLNSRLGGGTVFISEEEESLVGGKSWWFIPKKPIIVSHETSLKELQVEFLLCLSHIR